MLCHTVACAPVRIVCRLLRDEQGATAIEYVFIASLISISILVGATLIGPRLATIYGNVGTNLT